MQLNPYLSFNGNCEAAFNFYADTFGGNVDAIMRYSDMPEYADQVPPEAKDNVMHARMNVGGVTLMGADVPPGTGEVKPHGFCVSIHVEDAAEADRLFNALAENGSVEMPIQETFWATRFGMTTDKFGTPWMINCEKQMTGE